MKKLHILLFSFISMAGLFAQTYQPITNESFVFSTGEKEVFKVAFDKVDSKQVNEAVKEYLKNYKAKIESVKGVDSEFFVEEVELSDINQTKTTIAFKITELEGNASLYAHFLSNGMVVSGASSPEQVAAYKMFTEALAKKSVFVAYEDLIAGKEEVLKTQEKELKGLEKDEEKQHDAIGKANQSIKDSKSTIGSLEAVLKGQQASLIAKNKEVNDKEVEIASVSVKSLEGDIKTIEKEISSIEKENVKSREGIAKINGEIAIEETNLSTLRQTITAQKNLLAVNSDKKTLKEVQTLEKEEAKQIGAIEALKGTNKNTEALIQSKLEEINTKNTKIAAIQKQIAAHNEDALKEQLKLLQKDAKEFENEVSKTQKEIEKENSSISKQEEAIRSANTEIAKLKDAQAAKTGEINTTKSEIKALGATQVTFK